MSESANTVAEAIEEEALRRTKSRAVRPILGLIPFGFSYKGMLIWRLRDACNRDPVDFGISCCGSAGDGCDQ